MKTFTAVGSFEALRDVLGHNGPLILQDGADVVVLPTAAAFTGAEESAIELAGIFEAFGARVEALMNVSRESSEETYFAQRIRDADLVVLSDGSALHARSVWRDSLVGEAIREAHGIVAIGTVASMLGEVMIDPRGGAPTNGMGLYSHFVISGEASEEQLARTRSLLGDDVILATLGARGAVRFDGEKWQLITPDVVTTKGAEIVEL